MFPIISAFDVHGPCLPLENDKLNLFWRHTLQAYKSFCGKVSPAKAEELVTEPLFFWVIQRSWFARVNALCNLSCKKLREVAAHFRADF